MGKTVEPRSAGKRSLGSELVNVGTTDHSDIIETTSEIQTRRLRARFDFSPSLASAVAALVYPQIDSWQGRL